MTLPPWLPESTWNDYRTHRAELAKMKNRKRPKPFTPTAERRAIAKLGRLRQQGCDPVAVIDRSIDKGWEGLFALPDDQRTAFKPKERERNTEGPARLGDMFGAALQG